MSPAAASTRCVEVLAAEARPLPSPVAGDTVAVPATAADGTGGASCRCTPFVSCRAVAAAAFEVEFGDVTARAAARCAVGRRVSLVAAASTCALVVGCCGEVVSSAVVLTVDATAADCVCPCGRAAVVSLAGPAA
ncbi:MAG: hypothetical protein D6776_03360, partial [Planctomycetota bacterium]